MPYIRRILLRCTWTGLSIVQSGNLLPIYYTTLPSEVLAKVPLSRSPASLGCTHCRAYLEDSRRRILKNVHIRLSVPPQQRLSLKSGNSATKDLRHTIPGHQTICSDLPSRQRASVACLDYQAHVHEIQNALVFSMGPSQVCTGCIGCGAG